MQFAKQDAIRCDPELTPMVGVMVQVVIFLLLLLTFSLRAEDQSSRLAREPARPPATLRPATLFVRATSKGTVILGDAEVPSRGAEALLLRERDILRLEGLDPVRTPVVVQADGEVPTGRVQELIELAQKAGFEKCTLRGAEAEGGPTP